MIAKEDLSSRGIRENADVVAAALRALLFIVNIGVLRSTVVVIRGSSFFSVRVPEVGTSCCCHRDH